MKTALLSGITGQDGSYLAEFLLSMGYGVHGILRRTSTSNTIRIDHIKDRITLHTCDLTDQAGLTRIISEVRPNEVYNLASQSFVHASWDIPVFTAEVTAVGVLKILEAIRTVDKSIKFYQASSSEMFGKVVETPQHELTPFRPRSPYGVAKVYGHYITTNYRESYDMFCASGILFNHESPRRGLEFVTRKISDGVAKIKCGYAQELQLGNLDAKRDWGHARDYVEAMWMILQHSEPDDFVIGSGVSHSIRDFAAAAFNFVGLDYHDYVKVNPKFCRPADVEILCADARKARLLLGWQPKTSFSDLITEMVQSDLDLMDKLL